MINRLTSRDQVKVRKPASGKRSTPGDFISAIDNPAGAHLIETNGIAMVAARVGMFNVPNALKGMRELGQEFTTGGRDVGAGFADVVRRLYSEAAQELETAEHAGDLLELSSAGVMIGRPTDDYLGAMYAARPIGSSSADESIAAACFDREHVRALEIAGLDLLSTAERIESKRPAFVVEISTITLQNPYRVEQTFRFVGILMPWSTLPDSGMLERVEHIAGVYRRRLAEHAPA